jgi:GT2 family glycosyltransferase
MTELKQPTIFIVVLNFNGKDTLVNCLSSLYQSNYPEFEVVVVDNNSSDGSFEQARRLFSRARFIKNSSNLGFSKGNNIGIRYALEKFADYILVLNNDTLVEKTVLSKLAEVMEKNPRVGISSPLIFSADSKIWFAGGQIDWLRMKAYHLVKTRSAIPYKTQYISGCAMFIKKDVFKKIGLFDERFFLYYEDADFSVRARKAGFGLLVVPEASLQHFEKSNYANAFKIYWLVLSGLLFFRINASFLRKIWIVFYVLMRRAKNFYDLVFSKNKIAISVHKAYRDFKKVSA